ncbi:MAG: PSD1 and planctomycete cytochrome C domain-containing protein [Planctomycetaceae bacterium]
MIRLMKFVTLLVVVPGIVGLDAGPIEADDKRQFNRDVLPILADHCFACHGFDSGKREAGLRLDQQSGSIAELASGSQAIVPGNPEASELWRRVTSQDPEIRMPPSTSEHHLTVAELETLREWIEQGAEYERHWAYIAPQQAQPPEIAGVEQPIDRFIRARLATVGVNPAPRADRETLIRRVTLDLTGLPPAPLEVDAFVHDPRPDAWERVVDRLLESPHFGEKWARWWLDLAHYGDSDGYLQDFLRPVAWRYRQWVVDAFNRDLPFDQFTVQQLAGDLLPNATVSERMGTGFLRNTLSNREGGADLEEYRVNQVLDRTITFGTTWLALTAGCAQCHDHKFDTFSQREFYQLYAFFNNADEVNLNAPLPGEREPYEAAKEKYDHQREELLAPFAHPLNELQSAWEQKILYTEAHPGEDFAWDRTLELLGLQWGQNLGEGQLEGLGIIKTPRGQRTLDQQQRLQDYFLRTAPVEFEAKLRDLKVSELTTKLDEIAKALPPVTRAPAMMTSPAKRPNYIFVRGEYLRRGNDVAPETPATLPPLIHDGEPNRLALARWLVSPDHPLTARVAVNRLWQELFGRGLVGTSENFGVRGERPSHPELLDWLAVEFRQQGWSVKSILRVLVLSETYQQSSAARPELLTSDPQNRLVARQVRLRLSAEAIRDSALAVSGLLNPTIGGPSVKPPQPESVSKEGYANTWIPSDGPDRYRRGLYTFIQRTSPFAQFVTFDLPDLSRSCTRRERSNTPLQALNLLNDPVFIEAARALGAQIQRHVADTDARRLEYAFMLAVSRLPTHDEAERLMAYLNEERAILAADPESARELLGDDLPDTDAAWIALSSVLLNLDEFINRE